MPARVQARMRRNLERWIDDAPRIECDWEPLKATYRRSLVDLAALRFSPPIAGGRSLPAAGLPWFMTMFGRDSIFTSLQALPFTPELAATTLRALGDWQGVAARRLPRRGSRPHPPRDALRRDDGVRGAAALAVLRRRRRDSALRRAARRVRALDRRPRARPRARGRGARCAQLDRRVRGPHGQRVHLVPPPQRGDRAREPVLEGLVGLDLVPRRLAARVPARDLRAPGLRVRREGAWRTPRARDLEGRRSSRTTLERDAADLKRRFNRDYWVEDGEYFAIALDENGRQVDSLSSNNGHLLWSGIVDKTKAKAVARHLLGPRLFSGWGVRTLAEGEGRYNPIGYHTGTVWPFDNSFIAWGLRRYGFKDEAAEIAVGHPRCRRVLRRAPARGVRRLPAAADEVPGAVSDRVQPAGVVDGSAAPPPADDARARAVRRPSRRRSRAAERHRPSGAARHPRPLGPRGRLRSRARRRSRRSAAKGSSSVDRLEAVGLEQPQPDLAHRRERRDRVPQRVERHLARRSRSSRSAGAPARRGR